MLKYLQTKIPNGRMKLVREYRRRAQQCHKLVKMAETPRRQRIIQEIADTWRKLADEQEQSLAALGKNPRIVEK